MREFLWHFEFFFDLLKTFAGCDHFGDFISHDYKIALLLFDIFDASADMRGP